MDMHCCTCNEPWDIFHLLHDAIFEIGLNAKEAEAWSSLSHDQRLSAHYRDKFREAGWEFGMSVVSVIRCPCCPKGSHPNLARVHIKAALEEVLGDDTDGLAATFEDYNL